MAVADQSGDLPPTATLVKKLIGWHGPLSRREIVEKSERPETSIDRALRQLRERGVIRRIYDNGPSSPKYVLNN